MPSLSADSLTLYVSSTDGNDSNDGSYANPLRSIQAGISRLRSGYPDHLLLRRGDTWRESLGSWRKRGRSASEPMVITAYGDGPRPILYCGDQSGLWCSASSVVAPVSHLSVSNLDFYAQTRDPDHAEFNGGSAGGSGFRWLKGTTDLEISGCVFRFFKLGLVIQRYDGTLLSNVRLRHNQVLNSYSINSHSQGIYLDAVEDSVIEGNVFDHNGWNPTVDGAHPTVFNHNLYVQTNCRNIRIENNIISRAASHGCQLRCSGEVVNNLFLRNPIALSLSYRSWDGPAVHCLAARNVIVEGTDIGLDPLEGNSRGWGIDLEERTQADTFVLTGNVIAHLLVDGVNNMSIRDRPPSKAVYADNIVWDWPSKSGHGVVGKFDSVGPFTDPDRQFESVFGPIEVLLTGEFAAADVNDWYRSGFEQAIVTIETEKDQPSVTEEPQVDEPPVTEVPELVVFLEKAAIACNAFASVFQAAADFHKKRDNDNT